MANQHDGARDEASTAEPAAGSLGSPGHIRATIERARSILSAAPPGPAPSRSVPERAEAPTEAAERTTQESTALRAQLRASVTAYVRHLKADGIPSERMLVEVKAAVRAATPTELGVVEARRLMEDVVRWSVEAYYHGG